VQQLFVHITMPSPASFYYDRIRIKQIYQFLLISLKES